MPFSFDGKSAAEVLRASRIRFGKLRVTGVPAILVGVSTVVIAAGFAASMREVAPKLPEILREATGMLETRSAKRVLPS